ncbi:MAG: aminodeoxychorismate synthase component I, partial [Cupriavidus sp.]|nr:aminodeoxychorismate synthase component I [Cupriavidus sp.]
GLPPPRSADILPGVMRAVVLETGGAALGAPAEEIEEAVVTRAMLARAEAIVLVNALRGAMPATLLG